MTSGTTSGRHLFLSVDLDGQHHHLRGYGENAQPPTRNTIYETALPRIVALFSKLELLATFFVVAEDAAPNAEALQDLVARGHEVASQSLTHPLPFAAVTGEQLEREVSESRRELERIVATPIVGFRAPGFAASPRLFDAVARAGYAYDSSLLPSPFQVAALLALPAQRRSALAAVPFAAAPRLPHRLDNQLWEAPMSVTPSLRLPFYQTLALTLGRRRFDVAMRALLRRDEPLHYVLHGIDFLAPEEIDPRLRRHPGARLPLAAKLDDLEVRLRDYARGRTCTTLASRFEHGGIHGRHGTHGGHGIRSDLDV